MNFIETHFNTENLSKVAFSIIVFLILLSSIKWMMKKYLNPKISHQTRIILSKVVSVVSFTLLGIVITNQLGFSSMFTTVLGTAGIAGVAIGFASKTSLENIISGVLLLSDKSFKIDDMIIVNDVEGTVVSIDSLSVKIRTYDNKIVRVPNVKILNSDVTNLYPENERRRDFYFKLPYHVDVQKAIQILKKIADDCPYAIRKEETYIYFSEFDGIGYKIKYGVWFKKGDITNLSNAIAEGISKQFAIEGIEIPIPLLNLPPNA